MSIYHSLDYKDVIKKQLKAKGEQRGIITKLAEAAGCQRSYLSQVINSHVQLTPDQALGVCYFFGFNDDETNYFLALVDLARAATPALKQRLKQSLERIRKKNADLESRIATPIVHAKEEDFNYYSSWIWPAIHIAVCIPELQNVNSLARHLHLPNELVERTLKSLEHMGLIKNFGLQWKYLSGERHLSKHSSLVSIHHSNWRQRAVVSSQSQVDQSYHYTGVSAISRYDYQVIKDMLLTSTEKIRKTMEPSQEEELICLNIDFFKV